MDRIAKKIMNAVKGIFREDIQNTSKKSLELFLKQNVVGYEENVVEKLLDELLVYHIWRLCQKTFVYEFHEYRKSLCLPPDTTSHKAFDSYVQTFDKKVVEGWMEKYKVLKTILTTVVANTCIYVEEVSNNFEHDIKELCDFKMIKRGTKLKTITPLNSDPHNGSKIALCFQFEGDNKIIYKPRSLEIDIVVDKIFKDILKLEKIPLISPVARTLNKGRYGWQEFVKKVSVDCEHLQEAYYNLGVSAAVFSALGALDLHDENILFCNTMPYFVDLETCLSPTTERREDSFLDLMNSIIKRSVVATSILPAKMPTVPHQVLIGAINTPYPQKAQEKVFGIKNWWTDAVDIAKMDVEISHCAHSLTLQGDITPDPIPHQDEFVDGFTKGYQEVMLKQKQISELLANEKCPVRVIVRPTVQYALMLDAILFPEYLVDEGAVDRVLNFLKKTRLIQNEEVAHSILEQERKILKNGDIPYFYVNADENCMNTVNFISKKAFDITPRENAIISLKQLSHKRLIHEKRLIAEGYSEIRIHEAKYLRKTYMECLSPLFVKMLSSVTIENPYPILDLIISLTIENESCAGWLGGMYGENPISYSSSGFISFHDTGGILLLLERLVEYGKKENYNTYKSLLEKATNGINCLREEVTVNEKSVISGVSSLEYVQKHDAERLPSVEKIVSCLGTKGLDCGDVFSGVIGDVLMLSTFLGTEKVILEKMYNIIVQNKVSEYKKVGIAHGKLGRTWTEFRINIALGNYTDAESLYKKTLKYKMEMKGWCNGNAGLLMVLAEMVKILGKNEKLYKIALKALDLEEDKPIDLSICHGSAGILQSILFVYAVTKDLWYLSAAEQYCDKVLKIANKKGFYTGEKNRDYLMGYFLGWSGFADSILLLNIFRDGNLSTIPLNLSSDSYQNMLFGEAK